MRSLRILIITNLYPPHYLGGYELGCRDVTEALARRGHAVRVVTSEFRRDAVMEEDGCADRVLHWEPLPSGGPAVRSLFQHCRKDLRALRAVKRKFSPEVVLVFNTWGIWQGLLDEVQHWRGVRCAHLVSDYALEGSIYRDRWLQFWNCRPEQPLRRWAKSGLRALCSGLKVPLPSRPAVQFPVRLFTSRFVQDYHVERGLGAVEHHVVHWGIPLEDFPGDPRRIYQGRLLYSGQLREEKGIHTLVEAIGLLPNDVRDTLQLTVVGGTQDLHFVNRLKARVAALELTETIHFTGHVSREKLSVLYATHDVLVFCSEWDEPFSIALLEGMASGLTVIGTTTGGSRELLEDGVNAQTYPAGNARALADAILAVHRNPLAAKMLAKEGVRQMQQQFSIQIMAAKIEEVISA